MEQDNARFERSVEMFGEALSRQMEQTNAILAGFKDIFQDLAYKCMFIFCHWNMLGLILIQSE